jgi:hypothetical protein
MTIALVHPQHGTHFIYDKGQIKDFEKQGWSVRAADWKEKKRESDRLRKVEALKAEQQRITAELAAAEAVEHIQAVQAADSPVDGAVDAEPDKPKRKYVRKVA